MLAPAAPALLAPPARSVSGASPVPIAERPRTMGNGKTVRRPPLRRGRPTVCRCGRGASAGDGLGLSHRPRPTSNGRRAERAASAPDQADVEQASSRLRETLRVVSAVEGTSWASLDWRQGDPVLALRHIGSQIDLLPGGASLGPGLWTAEESTVQLSALFAGGPVVEVTRPAARPPSSTSISCPWNGPCPNRRVALAAVRRRWFARRRTACRLWRQSRPQEQAPPATRCHTSGSITEVDRHRRAAEVAQAFTDFRNRAGGDFFVVEAGELRAVLANRRCPLGASVADQHSLCRSTSALLGSLAARASGEAAIFLDEAIAHGDARCRALIDLDSAGTPWGHAYRWPPAGSSATADERVARGFRVNLSRQLPLDRLSVPVLRHLAGHTLEEFGVDADDPGDVELAVMQAGSQRDRALRHR